MGLNPSTLLVLMAIGALNYPGVTSNKCQLTHNDMDRTWLFLTQPSANTWDVLHTDYLNHGSSIYLYCNTQTPVKELKCENGQLREETNTNLRCTDRVRAEVEFSMVQESSCRRLGGDMYHVFYNLPIGLSFTLYEVCYSTVNEEPIYTRHKAYGFNLPATSYSRPHFARGIWVSREHVESFETYAVFDKFVELLGDGQTHIPTNTSQELDRGHLVNTQDFVSYDQMDETFNYINVIPQFRASNRLNWKRIETWVHKLPARDTYAEVVSGVYGILRLTHSVTGRLVDMYLMDNNKNPIPLWTYKVVKYDNFCYAFVTLNNAFNTDPNIRTDICQPVACPDGLRFTTERGSTLAYCCNYNHLVRYVGSHARFTGCKNAR